MQPGRSCRPGIHGARAIHATVRQMANPRRDRTANRGLSQHLFDRGGDVDLHRVEELDAPVRRHRQQQRQLRAT
jgi:hypothetical protein